MSKTEDKQEQLQMLLVNEQEATDSINAEKNEYHLRVYKERQELHNEDGLCSTFEEGKQSEQALQNISKVRKSLEEGFFENIIKNAQSLESDKWDSIRDDIKEDIKKLINAINENEGRGLVALTILQLCIKSIETQQDIRLHKSNRNKGSFSWKEGIPMRNIDNNFITPKLREYDLLKLSRDGAFMTRTLAENYPYTKVYKATIKGAKDNWLNLVEHLQNDCENPQLLLEYMISWLIDKKGSNEALQNRVSAAVSEYSSNNELSIEKTHEIILKHIEQNQYGARLLEVALHSFFQVLEDKKLLEGKLKSLTQMRSANKKAENLGDVEILSHYNNSIIIESWDTKYNKFDLYDELLELEDKLIKHPDAEIAGFITNTDIEMNEDVTNEIDRISSETGTLIEINSLLNLIKQKVGYFNLDNNKLGSEWLNAYGETLALKRKNRAPMDEPNTQWLITLEQVINNYKENN